MDPILLLVVGGLLFLLLKPKPKPIAVPDFEPVPIPTVPTAKDPIGMEEGPEQQQQ